MRLVGSPSAQTPDEDDWSSLMTVCRRASPSQVQNAGFINHKINQTWTKCQVRPSTSEKCVKTQKFFLTFFRLFVLCDLHLSDLWLGDLRTGTSVSFQVGTKPAFNSDRNGRLTRTTWIQVQFFGSIGDKCSVSTVSVRKRHETSNSSQHVTTHDTRMSSTQTQCRETSTVSPDEPDGLKSPPPRGGAVSKHPNITSPSSHKGSCRSGWAGLPVGL